jgi:acetylornithine deacetylase/succinyl-diaminopimelate desuccinylase-like protein
MRAHFTGAVCGALLAVSSAQASNDDTSNALARDLFKELVDINTTDTPAGNVTTAAQAMVRRLIQGGFAAADVHLIGANDRKKNVVVRLKGTGQHKPILLIGHLDVVEARRDDWSLDPFHFTEKDGWFYGRGTLDMKDGDAIMTAALIRLKREGFKPSRDIILALTADEEGGTANGVDWLIKNQRALVEAEFVLNHDGFAIITDHGKPQFYRLEATEKVYGDYLLTATNPGGHSSMPVPDNAIYELADALGRIARHEFPFELNGITRQYYEGMAKVETGQRAADMRASVKSPPDPAAIARLSRDPIDHSLMHTTCVATRLQGGHANNALPQKAQANVNCRILPGHSTEEVRRVLIDVIKDPKIKVQFVADNGEVSDVAPDRKGFMPPPVAAEILQPLEKLVAQMWPGIPVIPAMSTGASDSIFTIAAGMPSYQINGIANDRDNMREHGRDERVRVNSFDQGNEFFYRYLKALTSQ